MFSHAHRFAIHGGNMVVTLSPEFRTILLLSKVLELERMLLLYTQNSHQHVDMSNTAAVQMYYHLTLFLCLSFCADLPFCFFFSSPKVPSIPPPKPDIFFGRDDFVEKAVNALETIQPVRIPILGPGEIGKTSIALAILHHPKIQEMFKDRCYFVSCESTSSAEILLGNILQVLRADYSSQEHPLDILHQCLVSLGPLLLVLDNFETPWYESDEKNEMEKLLQTIAGPLHLDYLLQCVAALVHRVFIGQILESTQ